MCHNPALAMHKLSRYMGPPSSHRQARSIQTKIQSIWRGACSRHFGFYPAFKTGVFSLVRRSVVCQPVRCQSKRPAPKHHGEKMVFSQQEARGTYMKCPPPIPLAERRVRGSGGTPHELISHLECLKKQTCACWSETISSFIWFLPSMQTCACLSETISSYLNYLKANEWIGSTATV